MQLCSSGAPVRGSCYEEKNENSPQILDHRISFLYFLYPEKQFYLDLLEANIFYTADDSVLFKIPSSYKSGTLFC